MKLKEIARILGMNVNKLCETTGYSRQGIYQILNAEIKHCPRRWNASINALMNDATIKYEASLRKATEEFETRKELLIKLQNHTIKKVID